MPLTALEQAEYDVLIRFKADAQERVACENSLIEFLRCAWPHIGESGEFTINWHHEVIAAHLEAVAGGEIRALVDNQPPRSTKTLLCSVAFPAWIWAQPEDRWGPLMGPHVKFFCLSYGATLAEEIAVKMRRLVQGEWYQKHWGQRVEILADQSSRANFGNTAGGERLSNSIEGGILGRGGDIQLIDDPHSTKGVESLLMRQSTIDGMRSLTTRITDPRRTARVLIMQRLHQGDGTDYALKNWGDNVVHLCFPMRFEADRACEADLRKVDGELLWPEVFTESAVAQMEKELLEYGCTPAESPVLMSDLSIKPISEVRVGDDVVGFTMEHSLTGPQPYGRPERRKLMRATVKAVHVYENAEVMRLKMKSGATARCTADHKWYAKNRGADRKPYLRAHIGGLLARICETSLPVLEGDDLRDAGWLGGFFDGEGTVSLCHKRGMGKGFRSSGQIHFYQGAGRNLPLCEKLERTLSKFGFEYRIYEDERKENKDAACYGYRQYALKGHNLSLAQRFLHVAQPGKWQDRLIESVYGARFVRDWDRIEEIAPDGRETVYALETTTGNYVVWGYASSNSAGQLQQRPIPRGGGIIQRNWLQPWPPWNSDDTFPRDMVRDGRIQYPALEYVVGWVDTAYTEKQQNDPSAMIVLGVFRAEGKGRIEPRGDGTFVRVADDYGFPKVLLLYGWQKRLTLQGPPEEIPNGVSREEWAGLAFRQRRQENWGLVQWVADTVKRYRVDYLGIETQAAGHSLEQELRRVHSDLPCSIETQAAKGDKWARLYAVSGLISSGQVYVPTYEDGTHPSWAEPLVTELVMFPRAEHDEAVDTFSGALKHLRETAIFERREEFDRGEERSMRWETNRRVQLPYDLAVAGLLLPGLVGWLIGG